MFRFIKQHKILCVMVFLNVIAILMAVLIVVSEKVKTAVMDVYIAPSVAEIVVNDRRYDNFQSYNMVPGDYHAVISMDGMATKEIDFTLEENGFYRLWDYLLGEDGTLDYYLTHAGEEGVLAKVAHDEDAKKFIDEYKRKTEIINILPIQYDEYMDNFEYYSKYSIEFDEREDCPKVVCLVIVDNTGGNEAAALNKIRENGYNPEDYEITYSYIPLYMSEINK